MNETVADGVGAYKLKRSGEPTGFMKRFKETPPVIFGTDPKILRGQAPFASMNSMQNNAKRQLISSCTEGLSPSP